MLENPRGFLLFSFCFVSEAAAKMRIFYYSCQVLFSLFLTFIFFAFFSNNNRNFFRCCGLQRCKFLAHLSSVIFTFLKLFLFAEPSKNNAHTFLSGYKYTDDRQLSQTFF